MKIIHAAGDVSVEVGTASVASAVLISAVTVVDIS